MDIDGVDFNEFDFANMNALVAEEEKKMANYNPWDDFESEV